MKRTLCLFLSLVMTLSILTTMPISVSASSSGTCGENITWSLDNNGTLTISGTGDIEDYNYWSSDFAPWYDNCPNIESVVINEGITSLGDWAFSYCENLVTIEIPESISDLGNYTFYNCTSLESFTIPESITALGSALFYKCESLTSITIPQNVTTIGWYVFQNCSKLTEIIIPQGVVSIGDLAFSHCTELKSITIPTGITSIGVCTFEYCENLTAIDIPVGVTTIGLLSFYNCKNLTEVKIPEGVTTIGYGAFLDCLNLTEIELPESVITIEEKALGYYTAGNQQHKQIGNFKISAPKDSVAEIYSRENNFDFVTVGHTHTISDWIIDKEAFCTAEGSEFKWCIECKEVIETRPIPRLNHPNTEWIIVKKATVNSTGEKHKECMDCGANLQTAEIAQLKCSTPKLKSVENVADGVKFSWNKVSGADNYEIYRKAGSGKWTKLATVKGSVTSYTDKKAKSGTTYKYSVTARNEAGSSKYNTTGLTIKCIADPVLKNPTSTKKGITLKWNKVTGAQGYVVYRKAGNGKLTKLAAVKGVSKITYTDKKAKKGTKYTYQVKAYSGKTYSAYSNAKTIKDKY